MKPLIVIPAYNEAESIVSVVSELVAHYPQYDYIVVNDGSRDNTGEICRANGFNMLDLPVNLGLAGAVQAGLKYAYQRGYERALQFDGDGQHQPQYIQSMLHMMDETKADIVIGSRFCIEKKPKSLRMFGSYIISWAIRLTTGVIVCDPTSGMRLFNRKMIEEFAHDANYAPEPDTISYLLKSGAKIREVQVKMAPRTAGESYLNFTRSAFYMIKISLSILVIQWFRAKRKKDTFVKGI